MEERKVRERKRRKNNGGIARAFCYYTCGYMYILYYTQLLLSLLLLLSVFILIDRLTMKDLLQYLMSDDNMIIDPTVFDQCQDMWKPLNHYFINSSHNTYLNGTLSHDLSCDQCYVWFYRSSGSL